MEKLAYTLGKIAAENDTDISRQNAAIGASAIPLFGTVAAPIIAPRGNKSEAFLGSLLGQTLGAGTGLGTMALSTRLTDYADIREQALKTLKQIHPKLVHPKFLAPFKKYNPAKMTALGMLALMGATTGIGGIIGSSNAMGLSENQEREIMRKNEKEKEIGTIDFIKSKLPL